MPGATEAATLMVNVIVTVLPPGIVMVPHVGVVSPTEGFTVVGRVAPPPVVSDSVDA